MKTNYKWAISTVAMFLLIVGLGVVTHRVKDQLQFPGYGSAEHLLEFLSEAYGDTSPASVTYVLGVPVTGKDRGGRAIPFGDKRLYNHLLR